MAIVSFGKTWWGQQWLNSLKSIDNSNRLPRGATYARNGSVKSVACTGNVIRAAVKGSQPRPYEVNIAVPSFSTADVKKFVEDLSLRPVIISKLLNRELDPEVLSIAEKFGLQIFPKRWNDFAMRCSCPDSAVPCKHLAAVIYKVSAEIDNNPFMVFQLHNVDLHKELAANNIHINENSSKPPLLADLLCAPRPVSEAQAELHAPAPNFAVLPPILDALAQLLPDAPVFYPHAANFKDFYLLALRRVAKDAQRVLQGKLQLEYRQPLKSAPAPFLFSHHDTCRLSVSANNTCTIELVHSGTHITMEQCIVALWQIPAAYDTDYQPQIATYRSFLLLALNLLSRGAAVPQIVQLADGTFAVRWLPALVSKDIRKLFDHPQFSIVQSCILFDPNKSANRTKAKKSTGGSEFLPIADEPLQLCSLFLTELIHHFTGSSLGDTYTSMFFCGSANAFSSPGEEAVSGGILQWLQRFYLSSERFKPSIVVSEVGEDFKIAIEMQETARPQDKPIAVAQIFSQEAFAKSRFEILQSLSRMSAFIPGLDQYINDKGTADLVLDIRRFTPFLMETIPAIELLDIAILLPRSLKNILRPKSSVKIRQKPESSGMMRLDKLFEFDWQVAVGDSVMDEQDFRKLMHNASGLIKYKTEYMYADPADLEKLYKHFKTAKELSAYEMLRIALSNEYFGAKITLSAEVQKLIAELTSMADVPLPQSLTAQLRPYQLRGYSWMYRNAQIGFGSVLADDMGLGKTLQVIAAIQRFKEDGALKSEKAIVIAPTGLLTNWQAEIAKFAPALRSKLYHGSSRSLSAKEDFDVLITTYGILRSDNDMLKKKKWHVAVIDEAQNIKNHNTEQSKAVKNLKASTFIAMSGTPVENRLSELWSIMDFSNRGFLGSLPDFKKNFSDPIQNERDAECAERLKRITAPFLMRRMKTDKSIISDLPDKIEINRYCQLVPSQASLYETTLQEAMALLEDTGTDKKSLFVRNGLVLQMILALKQICNHPAQFLKNRVLDASMSGKIQLLFDTLEPIIESNEKVLIFTQFTEMGEMLKHFITERFGEEPLFYHGSCSLQQRNTMVDAFQTNRADKIFILSIKSAGTGLNLTAANHVIHYDLWWNPAVEAQATDRAYRIGQKSNVMVHRFITKNSFEEKINELIQSKKDLADMTVASGESWIGNLSNNEIKDIFTLGK